MKKSKNISPKKELGILTDKLSKNTIQGKYFKIKSNGSANLLNARNSVETSNYGLLLSALRSFKSGDSVPILGSKKIKLKDLFLNILNYKDFDSEFFWAKSVILQNVQKINFYLKLKDIYSQNILFGDYDEAEAILNKIENEFGYSIWLLKNKISFYQISAGLEGQKKFTNKIKKNFPNGSLAKFIIHNISVRNEDSSSIVRYKNQIEQIISKLNNDKNSGSNQYLEYQLLENENFSPQELIQIVRVSHSTSIIDYYESFLSLLKSMALSHKEETFFKKGKGFIAEVQMGIYDYRLNNLALIFEVENLNLNYDKVGTVIHTELLSGNVKDANKKIASEFNSKLVYTSTIILQCYSNLYNQDFHLDKKQDSLLSKIVLYLSTILRDGSLSATKEYSELKKISFNFSSFDWTSAINIIIEKENSILENKINGLDREILNSRLIHPMMLEFICHMNFSKLYENFCEKEPNSSLSLIYEKSLKHLVELKNATISPYIRDYVNSIINYKEKNFVEALGFADSLKNSGIPFYIRKANSLFSYSYIQLDKIKLGIKYVAETYVNDKNQYPFLPMEELCKLITTESKYWNECSSTIDLPIIFDAYSKNLKKTILDDKLVLNNKRYSYEDFLLSQNVSKPSELKSVFKGSKEENKKLIYFLRFICLESIMDLSGNFAGGSEEVIEERLQICRILLEIDPKNEIIYKEEISEIVRRQVIASRRQEVDQSRIYVDVKSIKERTSRELEESFYRFISYVKTGLSNFSTKEFNTKNTNIAIYTPENEVSDLLIYMIDTIRSSYLSSDIGLDRFISTRIRHGELERTIRIPVQKHHLITKKEVKKGPYFSNDYWIDKLNIREDLELVILIDNAFKTFSEKFDDLISEIANEWLQIKNSEKSEGLFDFQIPTKDLQMIAASITANTTLDEFIEMIINELDNLLIFILIKIRERLNNVGKEKVKELLSNLSNEIFEKQVFSSMELSRAITQARTDLTSQFDKVIEWFVPSGEGNSAPYTLEDAILVAEAIIKEANPNFEVLVKSVEEEDYSIHGQLPIFVDIFINIFENVVKRSGLEDPKAKIFLNVVDIGNTHFEIKINVINELGSGINIISVEETLHSIRERMEKNNYSKFVATDRNSGLFKIFKSINDLSVIDAGLKATMDFGIVENSFEMNMSVPFKLYRIEQLENENKNY